MKIFEISKIKKIIAVIIFLVVLSIFTVITALADDAVYQHNLKYALQSPDQTTLEFYKLPQTGIESDSAEIIDLANIITANINKSDKYAQVKAIHDWVANNIYYDMDSFKTGSRDENTALSTLKSKRAVCAGYTSLTVALLRAIDIPAKYVNGVLTHNDQAHAWCEVYIEEEGRWIITDIAGDSLNIYENGKFQEFILCKNEYFDISLKDISDSHKYGDKSFVISDNQFRGCASLTKVAVPYGFTAIGETAFRDCVNLSDINLSDGMTNIGMGAFYNCINMRNIKVPASLKYIGDYAFSDCAGLTEIKFSGKIENVGDFAFQGCVNLKNITFSAGVEYIGGYAFSGCSKLSDIIIAGNIKSIGDYAFWYCKNLVEITLPPSVEYIGEKAFEGSVNLTIYGKPGSFAESYAKKNGIKFKEKEIAVIIPEIPSVPIADSIIDIRKKAEESNHKIGDILGNVLNSDVKAYINGERIPCYNIGGNAVVLLADLRNYGFDVVYDNKARTSTVTRKPGKKFTPVQGIQENTNKPGTVAFSYLYTDIIAIVNGKIAESYNVQGNLAIYFSALGDYGKFKWDGKARTSELTLN